MLASFAVPLLRMFGADNGTGTDGEGVPMALVILPTLAKTAPSPCVGIVGWERVRSKLFLLREFTLVKVFDSLGADGGLRRGTSESGFLSS